MAGRLARWKCRRKIAADALTVEEPVPRLGLVWRGYPDAVMDDPAQRVGYDSDPQPLGSYVALISVFNVVVVGGFALLHREHRLPERIGVADLLLLSVATHKVSRLVAKDAVTSPVRAPFAKHGEREGSNEQSDKPCGKGVRRAVGELIVCPSCVGQWAAAGFVLGLLRAPKATRAVGSVFVVQAGSDVLHAGYVAIRDRVYQP
jgi:hypothetical protein